MGLLKVHHPTKQLAGRQLRSDLIWSLTLYGEKIYMETTADMSRATKV